MPAPPTIMPTNDRISALQEGALYWLITWLSPGFQWALSAFPMVSKLRWKMALYATVLHCKTGSVR